MDAAALAQAPKRNNNIQFVPTPNPLGHLIRYVPRTTAFLSFP
jgi:hypothetical protein